MTDRYQQILLLLKSRSDYDVTLPTSTGNIVRRQSKPGDGPSKKVPCPNCDGEKQTRRRGVPYDCTFCLSEKTGKPLGWIYVDGNINEPFQRKIGTAETGLVSPSKRVRCDACGGDGAFGNQTRCARCNGSGEVDAMLLHRIFVISEGRSSGDPRLDAIERRKEAGSYDELLTALGTLRAWPDRLRNGPYLVPALLAYRAVTVLEQDNRTLDQLRYDVIVMAAFTFIEPRMPAEIRVPRAAFISDRRLRESARKANRKLAA